MITIIDYKAGNLTSVKLAFEHIGIDVLITDKPADVRKAKKIVFPGVGAAEAAMSSLQSLDLEDAIKTAVSSGTPFLGICIGMQLLFARSQEDNGTDCLSILPGEVKKFKAQDKFCKIPQMGWNTVRLVKPHFVFNNIENDSEFYFVHSYYPDCTDESLIIGRTEYSGSNFSSVVARDNLIATQFHPERSGRIGLRLLENFANWKVEG